MNLVFLQRLDREGGGSRASLRGTMRAIREGRPGWELTLVTRETGPMSRFAADLGIRHRLARFPRFRKIWERPAFWWDCRRLAGALGGHSPDTLISNEWITAPHALAVARRLGVPAMSYVRDFEALNRGRKYQLHRMDRLLCVCESMRRELIGSGYDPARVRTVYNPIPRPESGNVYEEIRSRVMNTPGIDRWLLYLGRISPRKNQIAAVETLEKLRGLTGMNWGLLLAGDSDENYEQEVTRAAAARGLENHVLRLGMIKNPGWLIELADASIMTSKSEGLARVLIESFLCGRPAFSFPLDGLEDIYGETLPFFVAERRDPSALAARIAAAMDDADGLRERTEQLGLMLARRHSPASHVESFEAAVRCS